jgi:hypothetical protein
VRQFWCNHYSRYKAGGDRLSNIPYTKAMDQPYKPQIGITVPQHPNFQVALSQAPIGWRTSAFRRRRTYTLAEIRALSPAVNDPI